MDPKDLLEVQKYRICAGPDCIALAPGQCLEIFTQNGEMRLVRLVNEAWRIRTANGRVKNAEREVSDPLLNWFPNLWNSCVASRKSKIKTCVCKLQKQGQSFHSCLEEHTCVKIHAP